MHWYEKILNLPGGLLREGHLIFAGRIAPEYLLLALLACAGAAWLLYRKVAARLPRRMYWLLLGLRTAFFAVLLLLLAIPSLRTLRNKDEVFTAILVDTSRSMSLADAGGGGGEARMDAVKALLLDGSASHGILQKLQESGKVLLYGFDAETRRITSQAQLSATGSFTDIYRGVHDLEAELRGVPLAAVILITDGGRNTGGSLEDAAAILKARGVPLYTVGVGNPNPPSDYEVVKVVSPQRVRRNSEVEVQATVRHTGYKEPFKLSITRDGTEIASRVVTPSAGGGDLDVVKCFFTPDHEGPATYTIAIPPGKDEKNIENNKKEFRLDIRDDRLPVLYVEGSPRLEYRFLRRALYRDNDFRVVSSLRLGDKRFYIQGANEAEAFLQKGFPETPEELYAFQAVILGDIEAAYFTPKQLAMLEDFVRNRGGGLLMLGGVNSFGLGGYAGSPVARMLPVAITPNDGGYSDEQYKAQITPNIAVHPVMRLALDPEANRTLWSQAPPLIGITPVAGVKPGALTLLSREGTGQPVFVVQNYGAGRVAAFTSGGSWYWKVSVPSDVEFHEKFWKQLVRWLAVGAKERLSVTADADVYAPGKPAILTATVLAKDLQPVNDMAVIATLTDPQGNHEDVPMEWTLSEEGVYKARYIPQEQGDYRVSVRVESWKDAKPAETDFRVTEPMAEWADPGQKVGALQAMAQNADGRYFPIEEAAGKLPEVVLQAMLSPRFSGTHANDFEIWDLWPLWLAACALPVCEWLLRRRAGLA